MFMLKKSDIYEHLMEFDDIDQIWEGLAAKFYLEATEDDADKLSDIIEKGKSRNVIVPNQEMLDGWRFIKENIEGMVGTPEELIEKLIHHGHRTTTSNQSATDI